jgi:hypothetical protein
MTIHSTVPVSAVPNAAAMDGNPMFTIEASSVVMNIPTHTSATTSGPDAVRVSRAVLTLPSILILDVRSLVSQTRER